MGYEWSSHYLQYIPQIMADCSIEWINIFPRIKTKDFLDQLYPTDYHDFVGKVSKESPWYYFTDGIIRRDGKGAIKEVQHNLDLKGRTWKDRVAVHRAIREHEA